MATKKTTKGKARAKGSAKQNDLVITRVIDAPRDLVWKSWTEPERFKRWWGPKVFTTPVCEIDLRVGGKLVFAMRSPEGKDYWATGTYREISPMRKIVVTDSFADEKGNIVPATHYGMSEDIPLEMLVTVTFEDLDGKTRLTLRHSGLPAGSDRTGADQGWSESFDKLAAQLERRSRKMEVVATPGKADLVITRVFDAPRELVFRTLTDPNLIPEWWGPARYATTVERADVRPGGAWRFVQSGPDGEKFAFRGEYREIVPPKRVVMTFEFEGMPGQTVLETMTLEERDGKTTLTVRSQFPSVESRDGMLASGMEEGAAESYDRLEALLERRRAW